MDKTDFIQKKSVLTTTQDRHENHSSYEETVVDESRNANLFYVQAAEHFDLATFLRDQFNNCDNHKWSSIYNKGYLMHIGYSLELILKASIIKLLPGFSEQFVRSIPSKGGHKLLHMLRFLNFNITTKEQNIISYLEKSIIWFTRYPFSKTSESDKNFNHLLDNIDSDCWPTAHSIYKRVENFFIELRKSKDIHTQTYEDWSFVHSYYNAKGKKICVYFQYSDNDDTISFLNNAIYDQGQPFWLFALNKKMAVLVTAAKK